MGLLQNRVSKNKFKENYSKAIELMRNARKNITRINNVYWQYTLRNTYSSFVIEYDIYNEAKQFKKKIILLNSFCKANFSNINFDNAAKYKKEIESIKNAVYKVRGVVE